MTQNRPVRSNQIWTTTENKQLGEMIVELVNKGMKFVEAYAEAANIFNRSMNAVECQWRNLKKDYASKINPKNKKSKQPINITQNGVVVAALSTEQTKVEGSEINSVKNALQNLREASNKNVSENKNPITSDQNIKLAYDGRKKENPIQGTTKLSTLRKSIETFESEKFKVLNSGKKGLEYIVINHEEDKGYLVKVDDEKVVSCNCPHHQYRKIDGQGVICKHMLKIAFDRNLEVF